MIFCTQRGYTGNGKKAVPMQQSLHQVLKEVQKQETGWSVDYMHLLMLQALHFEWILPR